MNAPAAAPDWQARTVRLRRWTWGLLAAAVLLTVAAGEALNIAPYVITTVVENLLYVAVALGILAYFVARGESTYRRARATWFGALVIAVGIVPAIYVMQRVEHKRESEKVAAIVKSMADGVTKADQEYARRMKTEMKESTGTVLSSDAIADAAARKEARANLAALLRIIDESLSLRARIPEQAITQIHATGAPRRVKEAVVADINAATKDREPLSVQMMKGMRAYLSKSDEIVAHVDSHAGNFEMRESRLEFTDSAAGERYRALQSERAALEAGLRGVIQEKPR